MKKLIPAFALLLISAIVLATSSYAWFSMNTNVTASGMEITAKAGGSLLISQHNFKTTFDGASTTTFTTPDPKNYVNATHYNGTNWLKVQDAAKVDPDHGNNKEEGNLVNVTGEENEAYYVDYLVYIAAAGDAIAGQVLTAEVTFERIAETTTAETGKALSVAFLVIGNEAVGYNSDDNGANESLKTSWTAQQTVAKVGETNAIAMYANANATTLKQTVTIDDEITIPSASAATNAQVLAVVMRVYFDGDAHYTVDPDNTPNSGDEYDQYYVNSAKIDPNDLGISVVFNISNPETEDNDQD